MTGLISPERQRRRDRMRDHAFYIRRHRIGLEKLFLIAELLVREAQDLLDTDRHWTCYLGRSDDPKPDATARAIIESERPLRPIEKVARRLSEARAARADYAGKVRRSRALKGHAGDLRKQRRRVEAVQDYLDAQLDKPDCTGFILVHDIWTYMSERVRSGGRSVAGLRDRYLEEVWDEPRAEAGRSFKKRLEDAIWAFLQVEMTRGRGAVLN